MNTGLIQALLINLFWGFLPLFWKLLRDIPVAQVTAHRIIWSWVILIVFIALTKQGRDLRAATTRRALVNYAIAAALISSNWGVYVWAVNTDHLVEASLGFFITPLLSVFLGTVFFKEQLHPLRWLSLLCATAGVSYLTYHLGHALWISLVLALTGALYALVKKIAPLKSVFGLTLETAILVAPSLIYLILCEHNGNGTLLHVGMYTHFLLFMAAVFTAGPLLLFASAAQRIPLSLFGMLQYIAPTIQVLLGIFLFHEPFSSIQLTGFSMVWIALVIYVTSGFLVRARTASIIRTKPG